VAGRGPGVSALTRVEAIFCNPALYELAEVLPSPRRTGGRPRLYPAFMWLAFDALVSVYGSARQVEAELSHPVVWDLIRSLVAERFRGGPSMHLPDQPMRRHHYAYGRDRYLTSPEILEALGEAHRRLAAGQARELRLLSPKARASWTHPSPDRMLHADGKVLTPLFRAKPGDTKVDRSTGEIRDLLAERDASLHFEGTGETAWGTKFVLVAARTEDEHGRIILDVAWVPKAGAEARTAMDCFVRLAPLIPGAQGVIYDTALRGVHHQVLLRDLGLIPLNKVTAARKGASMPRRSEGRREEKTVHVEDKRVRLPGGSVRTVGLYARAGAIGLGELTDTGDLAFIPLARIRTHRTRDGNGRYRWYNDYALPPSCGGGQVTVRLHGSEQDTARRLNRTENVRVIPPADPDFNRLYRRRNDAESINRGVIDSLYLSRAHSLGHARQLVNLLGYALMVNSLALFLHRARESLSPPA
jgi:hypothetical protein